MAVTTEALCPQCRKPIPLEDVNVSTDIALCRGCQRPWSYADLLEDYEGLPPDPMHPPSGAWCISTPRGFEAGASTRSPIAFFLVPFMCVWSGLSLGGIYGTQIASGKFELSQSLFGIPFVIGTVIFGSIALMSICGKVTASVADDTLTLFTGIGPFGWRRRLSWSQVTEIRRTQSARRRNSADIHQITIVGDRTYHFAAGIKRARQEFLLGMLRLMWRETHRR